jgi:hypothetical protein
MLRVCGISLIVAFAVNSVVHAATPERITGNFVGCKSRDDLSRLVYLATDADKEAFGKFAAPRILAGTCHLWKPGQEAFVIEVAQLAGVTCLRPKDGTDCFWTPYEATQSR